MTNTTDATDPRNMIIYQGTGEWSALYLNGKLEYYGDHDNVHDHLFNLLGIDVEYTNDFLHEETVTIGSGSAARKRTTEVAYDTVEEIDRVILVREENIRKAQELRDQANALMEQAKRLESAK